MLLITVIANLLFTSQAKGPNIIVKILGCSVAVVLTAAKMPKNTFLLANYPMKMQGTLKINLKFAILLKRCTRSTIPESI